MGKHIGIVGCSAEGAALCYRTIVHYGSEVLGRHAHPEVSMHTPPFNVYVDLLDRGDWHGVAELMLSSAAKLQQAGADFLVCPDNTIHQAYDLVASRSRLPWLHIAEIVAAEASRRGFRQVAVLGTWHLTGSNVYPSRLHAVGIDCCVASEDARRQIDRIIFDELVNGIFSTASLAYFRQVIEGMKRQGCDAVVLGCTEIPLLVSDQTSSLPTLDSTRLLARAAVDEAVRGQD